MKIGMLTGGGDCPGLNAVIRAVVRKGVFTYSDEFVGFLEGWRGLVEDKSMPLDLEAVGGILPRGGTILRTSRTNPSKHPDGLDRCMAALEKNKIEALIAIGGDDTLSYAADLDRQGMRVIAVPKTMDNDVHNTEYCIGFSTAITRAMDAIERQRTTVGSHERIGRGLYGALHRVRHLGALLHSRIQGQPGKTDRPGDDGQAQQPE